MTIPSDAVSAPSALTWKDLRAIKYAYNEPFCYALSDGDVFYADEVARLVPGRRLVAFGTWQGKSVVCKMFFDLRHAKRHMEKDRAGIKTLEENKIPAPILLHEDTSKDQRVYVLMYDRIFGAHSLEEIWQGRENIEAVMPQMKAVIIELATQHVLGVQQHDLHLKNFLLTDKIIYTLDGAQIQLYPCLLPKKQSMNSLALFLSQLGVGVEKYQELLFRHYAKARGWLLKREDVVEMFLMIKRWNQERWQRFEKKIFRSSSDFAKINDWSTFGIYNRYYSSEEFSQFLANPESAFAHPTAVMLKNGRSSTVIQVVLGGSTLVVKRYNLKNFWHRLRRCLRPTRAYSCWRLSQKMNLFGVQTAQPAAFIEKRWMGLRGKSYFVTEYIAGSHAGDYFTQHENDDLAVVQMVKRIAKLLRNLARLEITHGDLKITNILINQNKRPVLIDLDGASEHVSITGLRSSWKREIRRFMQNFIDMPKVAEKFRAEFGKKLTLPKE